MNRIPEPLTELVVECLKVKTTHTGRSARHQLSAVLQRASDQMLLPIPEARRKLRRRMLEALVDGRPVWDLSNEHGTPARDATVLWPKDVVTKVVAIIDEQGNIVASEGITAEEVDKIKELLKGDGDVQDDKGT